MESGRSRSFAKLLGWAVCEECSDGLEISNGVFFERSGLESLKPYYNLAYAFSPANVRVIMGETVVRWGGMVHMVK